MYFKNSEEGVTPFKKEWLAGMMLYGHGDSLKRVTEIGNIMKQYRGNHKKFDTDKNTGNSVSVNNVTEDRKY